MDVKSNTPLVYANIDFSYFVAVKISRISIGERELEVFIERFYKDDVMEKFTKKVMKSLNNFAFEVTMLPEISKEFQMKKNGIPVNSNNRCYIYGDTNQFKSDDDKIINSDVMSCQLSGDHRVLDGTIGAKLLHFFRLYVEHPSKMLL